MNASQRLTKRLLEAPNLEEWPLKRIAWVYGCAPKGSDDERELEALLMRKVDELRARRS